MAAQARRWHRRATPAACASESSEQCQGLAVIAPQAAASAPSWLELRVGVEFESAVMLKTTQTLGVKTGAKNPKTNGQLCTPEIQTNHNVTRRRNL